MLWRNLLDTNPLQNNECVDVQFYICVRCRHTYDKDCINGRMTC